MGNKEGIVKALKTMQLQIAFIWKEINPCLFKQIVFNYQKVM